MRRKRSTAAEPSCSHAILLTTQEMEDPTNLVLEHLIVRAWKKFPRIFGLKGYEDEFPNSNKVSSTLSAHSGPVAKGYLSKIGERLYALTDEGRREVAKLLGDVIKEEPKRAPANRELLDDGDAMRLHALFESNVGKETGYGSPREDLTLNDAMEFWGITIETDVKTSVPILLEVRDFLVRMAQTIGQETITLRGGRSVTSQDITKLIEVHDYLLVRLPLLIQKSRRQVTRPLVIQKEQPILS